MSYVFFFFFFKYCVYFHSQVYRILTKEHKNIVVDDKMINLFETRKRNNWQLADSVYDVYLLITKSPREWFDIKSFEERYPTWEEYVDTHINDDSEDTGSSTENDINDIKQSKRRKVDVPSEDEDTKDDIVLFPSKIITNNDVIVISSDSE